MKTKENIVRISQNVDIEKNSVGFGAIDCDSQADACDRLNITNVAHAAMV